MNGSWEKDFNYAMTPLKFLSWPVGTWPLQGNKIFHTVRAVVSIFFLVSFESSEEWMTLFFCPQVIMLGILYMEMYLDHGNAEKNLDTLVVGACGILAISKMVCFCARSTGLTLNFVSAVKDYENLRNEEKRSIMRRHAYMGRMTCASVIFFSYFSSTLFTSVPMLAGDERKEKNNATVDYPIPSVNAMAVMNVPESTYLWIFFMEYLMLLLTSTGNLGSDSLFFGILFHLCGQVEILRLEFTRLAEKKEKSVENLNLLTSRHIYLLNMVDMLNETISSILIIQLGTSCLLICTAGFQFVLALNLGNVVMEVKTFIVLTTLLVQLFAYSYIGDYLKEQLENVGTSTYFSYWYNLPAYLTRDLIYVIMRAQNPVNLTAGKFFIVNMETYMSIVKTSMSYLSVLRAMVNA